MRQVTIIFFAAAGLHAQYTGFNPANIDKSADPCTNFFQYACGTWVRNNPIPADRARWSRFEELSARNESILRDILETSAAKQKGTAVERKIGDYYTACLDEKAIDAKGTAPLKPELDRIAAIKDKSSLAGVLARMHLNGSSAFFNLYSRADLSNSNLLIAWFDQGGLGLPDRDYYFRTDAKAAETRDKYVAHLNRMFVLLGHEPEKASASAKTIMGLETKMAKASMDRVARRNANNLNHPGSLKDVKALAPSFEWDQYLEKLGVKQVDKINIATPDFFKGLDELLAATSIEDLKTYLIWNMTRLNVAMLPTPFVNENFDFYSRTLNGTKELRPRWKRCVDAVDKDLGEALGQKYVELAFAGDSKERMLQMIKGLESSMEKDIQQIDWMAPETKKRALEKLHAVADKIGYPEKWRDYSSVKVERSDAFGNSLRANEYEVRRDLEKIGKAPDLKEWSMTPPTVNAYYSPSQNNINFPAGILQPPFFDAKLDDAVNYGGIGAVIGHELTHGFDDSGRRFDAKGNLRDWWTAEDAKKFEQRAECVEKQYSSYIATGDVHLNGKLTLGENVADNGGLRIAYMAFLESIMNKRLTKIDGYTPEQRFFLGWGQVWCSHMTDEAERFRAQTDPHSAGRYRVNGVVSNMPEFQQAFGCKVGQPMVRGENACRVW